MIKRYQADQLKKFYLQEKRKNLYKEEQHYTCTQYDDIDTFKKLFFSRNRRIITETNAWKEKDIMYGR